MNDKLKSALDECENVLFTCVPEDFKPAQGARKPLFIKKVITSLLVAAAFIGGYCALGAKTGKIMPGVIVLIAVVAAYVIASVFLEANKVRKQEFVITDKRLLCKKDDTYKAIPYSAIKEYRFDKDPDGKTCLLIGTDALKEGFAKWISLAASPFIIEEDSGICSRGALFPVPDAKKFEALFEDQLANK